MLEYYYHIDTIVSGLTDGMGEMQNAWQSVEGAMEAAWQESKAIEDPELQKLWEQVSLQFLLVQVVIFEYFSCSVQTQ
jgi:hypothetical protein